VIFLAFPSVKFRKIWQIPYDSVLLRLALVFQEDLSDQGFFILFFICLFYLFIIIFFAKGKDINLQLRKKLGVQTLLFSRSKFLSGRVQCSVKMLEDFPLPPKKK